MNITEYSKGDKHGDTIRFIHITPATVSYQMVPNGPVVVMSKSEAEKEKRSMRKAGFVCTRDAKFTKKPEPKPVHSAWGKQAAR